MTKGSKAHVPGLLILSVLFWAVLSDTWGYSERFFSGLSKDWNPYLYAYISRLIWVLPFLLLVLKEKKRGYPAKAAIRISFSPEILFCSACRQHALLIMRDAFQPWRMVDEPEPSLGASAFEVSHCGFCGGNGLSWLGNELAVRIHE